MAETQAQVRVLQTNSTDTMVHLIDPATNAIVGEIPGIPVAHGVAAAPDGSRIYVSGEAETALKVIDAHTLAVIKTIPLSARPNNISITPDGKKALCRYHRGARGHRRHRHGNARESQNRQRAGRHP